MLRRENAEVRQQLLMLVAAAMPPASEACSNPSGPAGSAALPASFWLDAQLKHCRRQVQLLSDALVNKAELTADLEVVLLQLRSVENGPPAQWCRDSLRRIRSIQFGEELAQTFVDQQQAAAGRPGARGPAGRSGGAGGRAAGVQPALDASAAGPGAAAARRGPVTRAAVSR